MCSSFFTRDVYTSLQCEERELEGLVAFCLVPSASLPSRGEAPLLGGMSPQKPKEKLGVGAYVTIKVNHLMSGGEFDAAFVRAHHLTNDHKSKEVIAKVLSRENRRTKTGSDLKPCMSLKLLAFHPPYHDGVDVDTKYKSIMHGQT